MKKIFVAANDQLKDIEVIETYIPESQIDIKTKQIIALRKEYPEVSLLELTRYYEDTFKEQISKSGLNHRLKKIKMMADQIREENDL